MFKTKTSDSGIFLSLTYQTMQKMGLDTHAIFSAIRLFDQIPDKTIRRDNSTQTKFWTVAENISQDTDIGLHVGEHFPAFRGEIIEYLFLSSPTFGDGLKRAIRYQNILTTALSFELTIHKDTAIISGLNHSVRHYLECSIGIFLKFLSYISQQQFVPSEIWLPYSEGAETEEYQRIWGCKTILSMSQGAIIFDSSLLNLASLSAEPSLLKIHEEVAEQQLKIIDKYSLIAEIENLFDSGLLESGEINQTLIAEKLQRNPRTLRADLRSLNTNFETVLAHYREKKARTLLAKPNITIDQIIYLLGFSEPSVFSRAFKRWTDETPSAYRQRKQQQANDEPN